MTVGNVVRFVKTDIWRLRLKNYTGARFFLIRQLRIIILAIRGYAEDKCKFRASALTYFSLLSIVPVIAMMFGIAKGFGLEEKVREQIMTQLQSQPEVAEKVIVFANSLLENANGGFVAGVGVAFLFWTVIKVLSNIENSFNDIWGIKSSRSIGRKFSDYLSVMLVCPILLVMSSSLTVAISGQVREIIQKFTIFSAIGPFIIFLLKLSPFVTIWVVFTFIFIFMPNTKVKFSSGLLAGIVAGTIFQLAQGLYIYFQVGVARYGAIYGSFATLPLFLIWLQISWLIVLFGAELAFAHQNVDTYELEPDCLSVSHSYKLKLSLVITQRLVRNFCEGKDAISASQISHELEIPIRLVRQILFDLTEARVVSGQNSENSKEILYQPAVDVDLLTVKYVKDALEKKGTSDLPIAEISEFNRLSKCIAEFDKTIEASSDNILLKEMNAFAA
ncbi:MAG: YihY/virulence factor BrkB family protein [Sedimentisphaerales bacterium]|nr:YihY/virulence factor BrkB family protein [Sedimentisphaerales bacterium]